MPDLTVVAVLGPTACGKTAFGVGLALALGGEVVNADAMAAYAGMDIGTDTPTRAQRRGVPHHLFDLWPVTANADVATYQGAARAALDDIARDGRVPLLVGGSGLYVRAALDELDFPGTDPVLRAALELALAEHGPEALHGQLAEADPEAAARISARNGRRVVRALEVVRLTGRPFAASMPQRVHVRPTVQLGLAVPRAELDERIARRVYGMLASGLVDEVARLDAAGLRRGRTASRALGYAQVLRHLDGELSLDQAREETVRATRRFARRQESWFRADPRTTWLDASSARPDGALLAQAQALLMNPLLMTPVLSSP